MTDERIIFGGGGSEIDSEPLDAIFSGWVGSGRLLYLPTALVDAYSMATGIGWLQSVFNPLGITQIEVWTDLADRSARDLVAFDAVYISGGNTFYLLHQLRVHHLQGPLTDFIKAGHPVYGGSAGAIILGKDITPCAHIDEDIVGLSDLQGFNLACGWAIWCHYQPADDARISAFVAQSGIPSLALSERSGAVREGSRLFAAGYEPIYAFNGGAKRQITIGQTV